MARPEKYPADEILDSASRLLRSEGPSALKMSTIASELGAPSGSIYHRFGSRDILVANLWLRSVERFHEAMAPTLQGSDGQKAIVELALSIVAWARTNPLDAQLLLLHRSSDLLNTGWPPELDERNQAQRARVQTVIEDLCQRLGATTAVQRRRVAFAAIDIPYAAVRGPLGRGEAPSDGTESLVADAVEGAISRLAQSQKGLQ